GYMGSVQITCDVVTSGTEGAPAAADLGAIAGNAEGFTDGLDAASRSTWVFATAQALLGLGGPSLGNITAIGAAPLPAARTCPPPTTPELSVDSDTVVAGKTITVTVNGLVPGTELPVTVESDP